MIQKGDASYTVDWFPELDKRARQITREWFDKGYIRSDIVTVQDDSADVMSGKFASSIVTVKPGGEADRSSKTDGSEYVQVALQTPFVSAVGARSAMTAISSSCKNPEAAIKMIEVINTDSEIYNMILYGLEGKNYNLADGFVEQIADSGYFYNTAWTFGCQFNAMLKVGQAPGIWEETQKINNTAEASPLTGFSFDEAPVSTEASQLAAVAEEYKLIELGSGFEEKFEEYQRKLKQAGIETYCAEVQKQLDEWLAATGKK
jgi:putative aldouronate transport system substrate-binding protein